MGREGDSTHGEDLSNILRPLVNFPMDYEAVFALHPPAARVLSKTTVAEDQRCLSKFS